MGDDDGANSEDDDGDEQCGHAAAAARAPAGPSQQQQQQQQQPPALTKIEYAWYGSSDDEAQPRTLAVRLPTLRSVGELRALALTHGKRLELLPASAAPPVLTDVQLEAYVGGGARTRGTLTPLTDLAQLHGAHMLRCTLKRRKKKSAKRAAGSTCRGGARFQRLNNGGDSSDGDLVL